MPRSLFLTLDGLDGTGKTTQCRLLSDWLRQQGREVVACAEPGGTALGDRLRQFLLHEPTPRTPLAEAFLFMASRAQLTAEVIRPALDSGKCVVCDRFLLATVVYQGHAGGIEPEVLWEIGRVATSGLEPDLTLVLDLPCDLARARRQRPADQVESRNADYHDRVRAGFLAEARRRPDRHRVIDASQPIEFVQCAIRREVEPLISSEATA
jgi:dTMP kinase